MIADSPYGGGGLACSPRTGAVTGGAGAVVMLGVLGLLQARSGVAVAGYLGDLGGWLPGIRWLPPAVAAWMPGFVLHIAVGALLGALYAASQQRAPLRGFAAVGLFHGVLLWVGGRVLVAPIVDGAVARAIHSFAWLLACLAFGVWLAGIGFLISRRAPEARPIVAD